MIRPGSGKISNCRFTARAFRLVAGYICRGDEPRVPDNIAGRPAVVRERGMIVRIPYLHAGIVVLLALLTTGLTASAQSLREKMSIENRLKELGIELPASAPAGATYTPVVIHELVAYVSGQLPRDGDRVHVVGQVGRDVSLEEGKRGARLAFIRALAALRGALGTLDGIDRMLKLTVFVHSAADFNQQSAVADGASELIFELFGKERGAHARTSVGVAQLPRSAAVEVEIIVALK
jgi:enamine deaminase RidA (YjgF/YER057c/UK114 family)